MYLDPGVDLSRPFVVHARLGEAQPFELEVYAEHEKVEATFFRVEGGRRGRELRDAGFRMRVGRRGNIDIDCAAERPSRYGRADPSWDLGEPLGPSSVGPFADLVRRARWLLMDHPPVNLLLLHERQRQETRHWPLQRPSRDDDSPAARSLDRVWELTDALARHAVARLDPARREVAMRYAPTRRVRIYELLENDPHGWLRQAAVAHPGVVLLAVALDGIRRREASETLLDALRFGHPLRPSVDQALESVRSNAGYGRRGWMAETPAGWESARRRLRLLVMRAGPRVDPRHLVGGPPVLLIPDDIPEDPLDNARWFEVMMSPNRFDDRHDAEVVTRMCRWASAHAHRLRGGPGRGRGLAELYDYLAATGRTPPRTLDAPTLFAEVHAWHQEMYRGGGRRFLGQIGLADEVALPTGPTGAWSSTEVTVTPLLTVGALREEGESMRHCAASWAPRVFRGSAAMYHLEVDGVPLTAGLVRRRGRWVLEQLYGEGNRLPTRRERELLATWLRAARASSGELQPRRHRRPLRDLGGEGIERPL